MYTDSSQTQYVFKHKSFPRRHEQFEKGVIEWAYNIIIKCSFEKYYQYKEKKV